MANKRILCDKTELVLTVVGKKRVSIVNLTYEQIVSIRFEPFKEFRFFRKVPSERISITTSKLGSPIVYTKYKEKKYFEEYKKELRKFAEDNRVTFYDDLE
ncbi:MAG: hypothetical protein GX974_00795 [Clostridiales bacterium]|nr:hypothetical protein [Clostridiales bacterium]